MNENGKRRREYDAQWVRNAWLQFWSLVAPAVLLALWGAWSKSEVMLVMAGFGLGTVWGNWQTASLHEMRHKLHLWQDQPPALAKILVVWHMYHHAVTAHVENGDNTVAIEDQAALDKSARLGWPTAIYLIHQSVLMWATPWLLLWFMLGDLVLFIATGFALGCLLTLFTDDWGHVWHHRPAWREHWLFGPLWRHIFSTEKMHGPHHDRAPGHGHYGNYPWCTPEVLWPSFSKRLFEASHAHYYDVFAWIIVPLTAGIISGDVTTAHRVTFIALPWAMIAWHASYDYIADCADRHYNKEMI